MDNFPRLWEIALFLLVIPASAAAYALLLRECRLWAEMFHSRFGYGFQRGIQRTWLKYILWPFWSAKKLQPKKEENARAA